MKVLFDTNVLISAILTAGISRDIIEESVYDHEVYYTPFVLDELHSVLRGNFSFSESSLNDLLNLIHHFFNPGKSANSIQKVCRDPTDDQIIADALENQIDVIITGDHDLLVLNGYKGLRIIPPKDYEKL